MFAIAFLVFFLLGSLRFLWGSLGFLWGFVAVLLGCISKRKTRETPRETPIKKNREEKLTASTHNENSRQAHRKTAAAYRIPDQAGRGLSICTVHLPAIVCVCPSLCLRFGLSGFSHPWLVSLWFLWVSLWFLCGFSVVSLGLISHRETGEKMERNHGETAEKLR